MSLRICWLLSISPHYYLARKRKEKVETFYANEALYRYWWVCTGSCSLLTLTRAPYPPVKGEARAKMTLDIL